jgi:1,4-alpha-glucan branching enzyme
MSLSPDFEALIHARHADPFAVLGIHADAAGGFVARTFQPGAVKVVLKGPLSITAAKPLRKTLATLKPIHSDGWFEGSFGASKPPSDYRFEVHHADGRVSLLDDAYRFGPVLGEMDVWLLAEGTHLRPYEVLGAHLQTWQDTDGVSFAVWAPNAQRVSVVGDFNGWDGRHHPMRLRRECGVWEIFLPGVTAHSAYKYEIRTPGGELLLKADPLARQAEVRPATASVVAAMPARVASSAARQRANAVNAPISIYEVHLGSWRRKPEEHNRFLNWDELAQELPAYAHDLGFTHLELLPITEHPFDGSWGYQPTGLFAPTARFGDHHGFTRFVQACHAQGVGVLLDWVPGHFPTDAHGLARFDGTCLYEHADPREGFHQDWNTLIYNFGRTEVVNYLIGNALYWLERYGLDGLRVDAVASMLYRDYSRKAGEWVPNHQGGRENLEAIAFLKRLNEVIGRERPEAMTLAEESTAFSGVSRPTSAGGLGFHYKWNMGWMHDTLQYMQRDPIHRVHHHSEMSFGMIYAYHEQFVLPISHDEVVHGKGSMLSKMPGDRWQQLANLRAYYGFMWGHPGKKLLFMGCEFGQENEWNHDHSLDWHLLNNPAHKGLQCLVRDLNQLYTQTPALHECDTEPGGFEWIDAHDAQNSVYAWLRRGKNHTSLMLVVSNFTPVVKHDFRVGVPELGIYRERLNTDSQHYGGSNVGAPFGQATAQAVPWNGQPYSIALSLPPLATVFLERLA